MHTSPIDRMTRTSARPEQLRQAAEQLVSEAFLKTLLRMHRENPLKGKYGHGGRGEEVFGAQLDTIFAEQASRGMRSTLTEAVMRQLARDRFEPELPADFKRHVEVRA